MRAEGRTFIVSGGASGLGRAASIHLCDKGAQVAILDCNAEQGRELEKTLGQHRARFFQTDVTSSASIAQAMEGIADWAHNTGKDLGGVITAAGIATVGKILDKNGALLDMNAFDATMAVNVRGTIDVVRQAMPHLSCARPQPPDGERGVIVMVSSVAASEPQVGLMAYSASKGAIATLALGLARDLAEHSVRAVAIAPGPFATPMVDRHPQDQVNALVQTAEFPKRPGRPDEFARLVSHIVENSMLNGTLIRLDAGLRMPSKL